MRALVDAAHVGAAEVVYFNPPSDERAHFVIKLIALRRVPVQYLYEPLFPGCQFILSGRLYTTAKSRTTYTRYKSNLARVRRIMEQNC